MKEGRILIDRLELTNEILRNCEKLDIHLNHKYFKHQGRIIKTLLMIQRMLNNFQFHEI